jgi:small GTP-binding protein
MTGYRKLTLKLILVGSSGVGKTSLVGAFLQQKFESQTASTVSPAFCTATIEIDPHTTVDLQLWDTAGQEQYQSISQMFYRESHIAFVCYDRAEVGSIEKWVTRVRDHAPDARVYLVATKSDLLSADDEAAVAAEGAQLSDRFRGKWFITSAVAGRNVTALFETAARDSAAVESVVRSPARPAAAPPPKEAADDCC